MKSLVLNRLEQLLAKAAKDVSAAMVLIAAIASVVVGLAILGPRLAVLAPQ